MFLISYSINWPNFIVWSPLLLEILGNMCIALVCFPGCDVINFEINFIFSSNRFSTWPKSQNKKLNIFGAKRAFKVKWKAFFSIFKALSDLRPEIAPLRRNQKFGNFFVRRCTYWNRSSYWRVLCKTAIWKCIYQEYIYGRRTFKLNWNWIQQNFSRASSRGILYDLFLPYCNINLQKTDDKKLMFKKDL